MKRRDADIPWLPGLDWTSAAPAAEPADAEERRRALDPETSFIVQAPAGSGKTELLIQRYLALLGRVAQPESIAAITFTVKAAGEMRARVLDALEKAAHGAEPATPHERRTLELAQAALAQDRRQAWNLLRSPDRLRIQTIDALSMSITRQMPWLARFGAMPDVVEDARVQYREAAARAVQELGTPQAGDAVDRLLEHLDNDAARTVDLLASMLATRDHWLRVIGGAPDPEAVRTVLEAALGRMVKAHLSRLRSAIPARQVFELLELARYAGENVRQSDPVISRCAGLYALPNSLDEWMGLASLLLTGKGDFRKRVDRGVGFPPHNKAMKQRMEGLLDALRAEPELCGALAAVPKLPAPNYTAEQWNVLEALFTLLPRTVAHLRGVFAETGRVDFVEIASAARRALGDAEQPTDLALSMGARIEHLLVDEFQDTSVTQFDLLRTLTAGWEDDGTRTVFLVGDPMQSIYRFRQAEVGLFLNVRESGIGALQPEPLALKVNFRSARTVVEWVNNQFAQVFPAEADALSGAIPYTPSIAFKEGAEGAAVTFHPFLGRNDMAEADLAIDLHRQARREDPASRTAILVRSRAHLATIADRLRQAGVAYRAIEIQALAEKPLIQDLLALTRALLHLADRVAWLAILRAPWCGLTLDALHRIAAGDRARPILSLLRDPAIELDADSTARVAAVLPVLEAALERRGRAPVSELVESAFLALAGDRLADANELADARAYFDLLEEAGGRGDIADFDRLAARVTELFANPGAETDGGLELMTIHKAKGLEFDTVILPGLGKRPKTDVASLLVWAERPSAHGADLLMAPISGRGDQERRIYDFIRRENDAKGRHESERLLYVACTRARTRLHLLAHVEIKIDGTEAALNDPPRESLLHHLWGVFRPEFERRLPDANLAARPDAAPVRVPRPLRRVRQVVTSVTTTASRTTQAAPVRFDDGWERHAGTLLHRLFDRISRDGLDAWPASRAAAMTPAIRIALAADGVAATSLEAACAKVAAGLSRTLEDPRGRWILGRHQSAVSEFAIATAARDGARHLTLDRTFADDEGTRWIVDFKTAEPDDAQTLAAFLESERRTYAAQLNEYATALRRLDQRPIRAGLYFPLIGGWIEWDAD
ncbi:MAG: UvrD-helicase domain-containing protein [Acidobacteria bacterium]|nr:UvrD-helicase domain-containing protein [Acidobacteriota bacterium]